MFAAGFTVCLLAAIIERGSTLAATFGHLRYATLPIHAGQRFTLIRWGKLNPKKNISFSHCRLLI